MEQVECKLLIEMTDSDTLFGDSWNFSIDEVSFAKLSDKNVEVTFFYDCEVETVEDGVRYSNSPSEWDKEYIDAEEKLQRILDLICLEKSGIGMRIVDDSQRFSHRSGSSSTTTPPHVVEVSSLMDIEERYKRLNENTDDRLADALRFHRLSSGEENVGEEIAQLWGTLESLYAEDQPKVLADKDKRGEINDLINTATQITSAEKEKLKQSLAFVNAKSMPDMMAEKLSLANGDGKTMTKKEVSDTLKYWRGYRSAQSHGSILIRDGEAHRLAGEMGLIIETILSAEVSPSRYVFVIFHPDQLIEGRFADNNPIDDGESGYVSKAIHKFASMDIEQNLKYQLKDNESCIYLIDYKEIKKVSQSETLTLAIEDLPQAIQEAAEAKMRKLNHEG